MKLHLNLGEAAKIMKVSKEMVRRYIANGSLLDEGDLVEVNTRHRIPRDAAVNYTRPRRGRPVSKDKGD